MDNQNEIAPGLMLFYETTYEQCGQEYHYPHTHDFCELYFYIDGKCSYMVENGIYRMSAGTVIFTRPGELHSVRIDEPCSYTRFYYQFNPQALELVTKNHLRCFFGRPFGRQNSLMLSPAALSVCLWRIKNACRLKDSGSPDFETTALADFLYTLTDVNRVFDQSSDFMPSERLNPLVSDALDYINSNLEQLRSTESIAQALYVSREYLSRSFSREMGITLSQYILKKRISNAKTLIAAGSPPTEASTLSGFDNYSYFIQVFKRETGMTPREWKILPQNSPTLTTS